MYFRDRSVIHPHIVKTLLEFRQIKQVIKMDVFQV